VRLRPVSNLLSVFSLAVFACGSGIQIINVPENQPLYEPYKATISASRAVIKFPTPRGTEEFYFIFHTGERGGYGRDIRIDGNIESLSDNFNSENRIFGEIPSWMDYLMRNVEREASERYAAAGIRPLMPKFIGGIPPDTANFNVLDSYNSLESYTQVTADLVALSSNSAFYADRGIDPVVRGNASFLPAINRLQQRFDDTIAPVDRFYFGRESDVDGVGQVIVLMTPVVNGISPGYGNVLGFFYAGDLFSGNDYPSSNETEIFYIAVPLRPDDIDRMLDQVSPSTLAHEFQHMINFNQHVLLKGRERESEEIWVNEGLSHLAEDLAGFGDGNRGRAAYFLYDPKLHPLATDQDSSGMRGAAYLFFRYIHDRFDSAGTRGLLRQITGNRYSGTGNISDSIGADFESIYQDWLSAVALVPFGISSDPAYSFAMLDIPPRIEDIAKIDLSMKPTTAIFYSVKAGNSDFIEISLAIRNNSGCGAVIIPVKK
jgi:hypothetical protein